MFAGSTQTITYSPRYAAPEVAAAKAAGASTHVVAPALDVWALGVMAFELLAARPAFSAFTTVAEIFASLLEEPGAQPLPWADPNAAGDLEQLGNLRGPVLACLSPDPKARPTANALVATIHRLFGAAAVAPSGTAVSKSAHGGRGLIGAGATNTWVTRVTSGLGTRVRAADGDSTRQREQRASVAHGAERGAQGGVRCAPDARQHQPLAGRGQAPTWLSRAQVPHDAADTASAQRSAAAAQHTATSSAPTHHVQRGVARRTGAASVGSVGQVDERGGSEAAAGSTRFKTAQTSNVDEASGRGDVDDFGTCSVASTVGSA